MLSHDDGRILGVDIDNVVALTDPAIRGAIWENFGVWLDQEQVVQYRYSRCGVTEEQERRALELFNEVTCKELDVVLGAIEALTVLKQGYLIILVTSRPSILVERTEDWLRRKSVPYDLLLFEKNKHQTEYHFTYFVEDNADLALSLAEAGIHTFLFDYPWNRSIRFQPNITRVAGWSEVLRELTCC